MAEPHAFRLSLRVYWEDTDGAGIVYYANYLKFAERARTEMLRTIGVEQGRVLDETGIAFAVRRCACEYLAPARLDDVLEVETEVISARGAVIELRQRVLREGRALAALEVTVVAVTRSGRPARLPPAIRHALAAFPAKTP